MNQIDTSYHGNPNLKPVGYQHDFTKKQLEEFVKCVETKKEPISNIDNAIEVARNLDLLLKTFRKDV